MGRVRSGLRGRALGTVAVAAGGFTAGGLAMVLGLSVAGPDGRDVRVVLQDDSGSAAGSVAGPASEPAAQPTVDATSSAPTPAAAHVVKVRTAASSAPRVRVAAVHKVASTPRAATRAVSRPPVVQSTGS